MYVCNMYVRYIRDSVYLHPAPFVCNAIFPYCMLVNVNTVAQDSSRDRTSRTEKLNSRSQHSRDLKMVRKGRHD